MVQILLLILMIISHPRRVCYCYALSCLHMFLVKIYSVKYFYVCPQYVFYVSTKYIIDMEFSNISMSDDDLWIVFPVALQPNGGHGLLILEVCRSHSDATQSIGLLWMSDQLITETSTWQHTTLITDKHHVPGGIWTHSLSKQSASNPYLGPRGHWDLRLIH